MSTQKSKKGFTLIELMVVIVIIGILAAIAIPKLFGMSAKAKAQEVGPAVSTWSKMQLAYKMETGKWGTPKQISYKAPGSSDATPGTGTTSNFKYTVSDPSAESSGEWKAESEFAADLCIKGSSWTAKFTTLSVDDPEMAMSDAANCEFLTPNYLKIGKPAAAQPEE